MGEQWIESVSHWVLTKQNEGRRALPNDMLYKLNRQVLDRNEK